MIKASETWEIVKRISKTEKKTESRFKSLTPIVILCYETVLYIRHLVLYFSMH